jgi:hypothetical protein
MGGLLADYKRAVMISGEGSYLISQAAAPSQGSAESASKLESDSGSEDSDQPARPTSWLLVLGLGLPVATVTADSESYRPARTIPLLVLSNLSVPLAVAR